MSADATPSKVTPLRILLVDDSDDLRAMLHSRLDLHEHLEVVAEAPDGQAALEAVAATRPDVVVMDLAMPEMDGLTAATRLRQEDPDLVLVALTGYSRDALEAGSLAAGFDHYVVKGGPLEELEDLLGGLARGRGGDG